MSHFTPMIEEKKKLRSIVKNEMKRYESVNDTYNAMLKHFE